MKPIFGPIQKSKLAILFFVVPAAAMLIVAVFLAAEDTGSFIAGLRSPTVAFCATLALGLVIWGVVFMSKPIVTLTADGVDFPNGRRLAWADIASLTAGQSTSTVVSANTPPRKVVHEVTRLHHHSGEVIKIPTTWAAIGPQPANERIKAAFDAARRQKNT